MTPPKTVKGSDEPDTETIIGTLMSEYRADRITVAKLSAHWSKEAQEFLDKNDLIIVGNIKEYQSVIALGDGLVVELYR
jgi:hypothetical protein